MNTIMKRLLPCCLLILISAPLHAQWTTQTIDLNPGWNAVFLEVQPEPAECSVAFAGIDVESAWAWNRRTSSVQFIQDPSTLVPAQPDWLTYLPPNHSLAGMVNLFILRGGQCYLIKRPDNAPPVRWTIRGIPSLRTVEWNPNSLNFVGFSIPADSTPTFQSFFSSSPAHSAGPVYRLSELGTWVAFSDLSAIRMRPGEAFWIQCKNTSDYTGPLKIFLAQSSGLNYGRSLVEQIVRIKNLTSIPRSISIRTRQSESPPMANVPALAGIVPLYYWNFAPSYNTAGWVALTSQPVAFNNLAPGQELLIRLEVRRAEMESFTLPPGYSDALYQSLVEITDTSSAVRVVLPVTAQGLKLFNSGGSRLQSVTPGTPGLHAGLWVGSVVINYVSQPANLSQPTAPLPTASEFQFRLILHVDSQGRTRLLRDVIQMWKPGTYKPDPNDPTKRIVDVPGRYVLVTDKTLVSRFSGAALRDGEPVGRRFSTAAFAFSNPVLMSATGEFGIGSLRGNVLLNYDDPLNPFLHRYHPDHDNLDERFEQKLPEGKESFNIARDISFEFAQSDPFNLALAGWGDTRLGGFYRETITGLNKEKINIEGKFQLQLACRVDVLNDGL